MSEFCNCLPACHELNAICKVEKQQLFRIPKQMMRDKVTSWDAEAVALKRLRAGIVKVYA